MTNSFEFVSWATSASASLSSHTADFPQNLMFLVAATCALELMENDLHSFTNMASGRRAHKQWNEKWEEVSLHALCICWKKLLCCLLWWIFVILFWNLSHTLTRSPHSNIHCLPSCFLLATLTILLPEGVADVSDPRLSCRETRTCSPNGPFVGCWLAYPIGALCVSSLTSASVILSRAFPCVNGLAETIFLAIACLIAAYVTGSSFRPEGNGQMRHTSNAERRPWWERWRSDVYSLHTYHVCVVEAVGWRPSHIKTKTRLAFTHTSLVPWEWHK